VSGAIILQPIKQFRLGARNNDLFVRMVFRGDHPTRLDPLLAPIAIACDPSQS
jgi:hypothetical protein